MSKTCTLNKDAILNVVNNFSISVLMKYDKFPPREDDLEKFAKARQDAKEHGASDETLDSLEDYLKKVHLGIIEYSNDRATTVTNPLVTEVMDFFGKIAIAQGYTVIELTDD